MRHMSEFSAKERKVKMKKTRLELAEEKYEEALHAYLTNPASEKLSNEAVEEALDAAFCEFYSELILNEDECCEFIAEGGRLNELDYLEKLFNHFKSRKIYLSILENCRRANSGELMVESQELKDVRAKLIAYMEAALA